MERLDHILRATKDFFFQGDLTSSFEFGGGHRKGGHSSVRHSLSVQIAVHVRTALDCRGTNFRLL